MSTYYDELGLTPQASATELQTALDEHYNQYRSLITHPDPETRAEAEGNQRRVERMREELLDPAKRAAYDASINVDGEGALSDPTATPRSAPPRSKKRPASSAAAVVADLWSCPNCSTPNSEWTPFCMNCRAPLLRQCPECEQMKSLVKTGACGNCGYEYTKATKRAALREEIQTLNDQLKIGQNELVAASTQLAAIEKSLKSSGSAQLWTLLLFVLPGGFCMLSFCASIVQGNDAAIVPFIMAVPFLAIAAIRISNARTKEETSQNETVQLQQHTTSLNAEIERLQNEMQGKQAAFDQLGQ